MEKLDYSKLTFLLGSGVSIPSKNPSTWDITRSLLTENWLFERDQSRCEVPLSSPVHGGNYPLHIDAIKGVIRILRSYADQHLVLYGKGESTYEDIYYLSRQLIDGLHGEYDNPALLPFLFELRTKISLLIENLNSLYGLNGITGRREKLGMEVILAKSIEFIEEAVAKMLENKKRVRGLALLKEVLKSGSPNPLNMVTLNHDTLLERCFSKYSLLDGFVKISQDAYFFDPVSFTKNSRARVNLLKLHGSINWYRYKAEMGTDLAVKVLSKDPDKVLGQDGKFLTPPQGRLLLAGTTNKELAYGSGIFLELMFQFHKRLKETDLLIVSGYGFADKGINNRIWAWLDSHPENRILVLHEKIDELRRSAKPSFAFNMDRHKETKKFAFVDKWMCDCSLEDIQRERRISLQD